MCIRDSSTLDLLGVELEIASAKDRAHRHKNAIEELVYDQRCQDLTYILIDCPPSLSLITINAMTAADAVLVPLQCEFFALEGLSQLLTVSYTHLDVYKRQRWRHARSPGCSWPGRSTERPATKKRAHKAC